jgi:hypothetical protein
MARSMFSFGMFAAFARASAAESPGALRFPADFFDSRAMRRAKREKTRLLAASVTLF